MRFLEILLLVVTIVLPFYSLINKKLNLNNNLTILAVITVLLLHLIVEGYRWQMLPFYILIAILLWFIKKEWSIFSGNWIKKIFKSLITIILLVFGFVLPNILPVFKLPKPTGKHLVGSQYIHFKTNQDEIITSKIGDKRELMIKVWYPSKTSNNRENYLNEGDKAGFALKYGLPLSTFNYLKYVETNTYKNAEIVNKKIPVLIFSHGYYSKANGYYALLEEIVSHGYIVLAINHTYESTGSLFPNNNIKFYNNEYNSVLNDEKMASMAWTIDQTYRNTKDWDKRHKAIENGLKNYSAAIINDRWSDDIISVINKLEEWNETTFLKDNLDMQKIGVFGHSQGGTAAGESIIKDTRVKAAISLDGVQWGKMIDTILPKPFAVVSSDWPNSHPDLNQHAFHNGSVTDFYNAKILNSGHSNFMDIPLMINLKLVNEAGSIPPKKATQITADFVLNFFDKYLKNQPNDILNLAKKHPELKIELHEKSNTILE